jgi:hypothetical protein
MAWLTARENQSNKQSIRSSMLDFEGSPDEETRVSANASKHDDCGEGSSPLDLNN